MSIINPESLTSPRGYSNGILHSSGALLSIAGQVAWDREEQIVSDVFSEQFDQALGNVLAVVTEAGGTPESIVKLTIFVTDASAYLAQRKQIGIAYRRRMGKHFPAMTLVQVAALIEAGAQIEIEGLAVIDGQ
ncbi:MAG: RidA family protein [Vicinamibacterales bacterium]|jgi:enamine deaminase RidA (YjgF/YER057c/UK114 family)|nr:enamine deaminase RidA [Acidobacteriota bacterium]MDP7294939.1 RidA family protein [Vicinamibacterales bacterium]MDP7473015.1 RidA family protein [Vicinamibacterales bacterium]MDP7670361.1 RidA family protein [Vicinamibacterales bacterium]HJO38018.1 RidA family protein [Vicinamibacterales bacterium]|tara:strand:- start:8 stop:406 length:399 start_codon:yes stop_codon:yes gene_type:complete